MIKSIEVTQGARYYHFTTIEIIKKCPHCKREYLARKLCLDCYKKRKEKVKTINFEKIRTGYLTLDLKKFMCSCIWGSWFRWGKHWQDNYPNSRCKHVKLVMRKIKKG